ncbi:hypothetical protein D1013_09205 [Euzebyella marina]|uniref:Uncharacterized protein n=1 Tax=Euzebyella marina TaxID=1761453 RepID=A0A3G2L5H4_9FLAO|nr:hypothetical protein D1013_09205 [Euzebyella marina]
MKVGNTTNFCEIDIEKCEKSSRGNSSNVKKRLHKDVYHGFFNGLVIEILLSPFVKIIAILIIGIASLKELNQTFANL